MIDVFTERIDYFKARATCEVTFPVDRMTPIDAAQGQTINVAFVSAMRGCGTKSISYSAELGRNTAALRSLLTWFHADDERPAWVRGVQLLTRGATPPELPHPLQGLASRLLGRYGAGSITVTNDPRRPITGELVAGEPGQDGEFFPADSYFDQFLLVRVGGRTFTHRDPLRVSAKVRHWPPQGENYRSERATDFFDLEEPDGPVAFRFGNCNIDIVTEAENEEVAAVQDAIAAIHGA